MSPSHTLPDPKLMIDASVVEESNLRARYVTALSLEESPGERVEAKQVLRKSAFVLELVTLAACLLEELDALGAASLEASGKPTSHFMDRVRETSGLDFLVVFAAA